jgi:hypothetical protein
MATKTEVKALVALLEQDWEDVEELAKALVTELDNVRASGTRYVGVMQFGMERPFYVGVGPYAGFKSALNALNSHPAAADANYRAVVPMVSKEGLEKMIEELDTPPESVLKDNAASKKAANQKFAQIMAGERTVIKVKNASDIRVVRQ